MAWPLKEPSDPPPSPMVVEPLRAFQVWGPTTPSTLMPAADCRLRTAVRVAGPKDPSTASEAPRSLSLVCRVRPAWPRAHWRSLGCVHDADDAQTTLPLMEQPAR